jgi:hypothetical protein
VTLRPTGEVHPAAAVFPMLPSDELAELAEDVAAHGLREPIVLTPDGVLLDGRNRLAACKRAKVKPAFVEYDGDDPEGYVLSVNVHRRHLTAGQRAMAVAQVCSISGTTMRAAAAANGLNASRIAEASVVLQYAPDLVPLVHAGKSLAEAYREAQARRDAAEEEGERLTRLRAAAPDLAERVELGELSLDEARAEARDRAAAARLHEEEERRDRERRTRDALLALNLLRSWGAAIDTHLAADFDVGIAATFDVTEELRADDTAERVAIATKALLAALDPEEH